MLHGTYEQVCVATLEQDALCLQGTAQPAQALPETSKEGSAVKGHPKGQLLVGWAIQCKHHHPHALSGKCISCVSS